MDTYKVAVYNYITGEYSIAKSTDNYYDGVIETIVTAKAKRSKAALLHDGKVIYVYDSNR